MKRINGIEGLCNYLKFKLLAITIELLLLIGKGLERICGQLLESVRNVLRDGW